MGMKIAVKDAIVTVRLTKEPSLPFDWKHEIFLNGKRISHGLTELDVVGEFLDMILTSFITDHRPRFRAESHRARGLAAAPRCVPPSL